MALGDRETRDVHIPPGLQPLAADVFRSVNVPVRFASGKTAANSQPEGRFHLEATVNDALNMAEIVVDGYGEAAPDEIHRKHKEMLLRRIDVIHLVLNLEDLRAEEAASQAEALGFFFAGILPFGSAGRHALILQHLNNVRIDVGRIKLFSPEAALILKFIERSGKL